jgi:hypothetical protein
MQEEMRNRLSRGTRAEHQHVNHGKQEQNKVSPLSFGVLFFFSYEMARGNEKRAIKMLLEGQTSSEDSNR